MRKLILLLLLASPVSAQWANVGTNILGNRYDPATVAHPGDTYTLQFQLSTKKWLAVASGSGSILGQFGGGVTAAVNTINATAGLTGAIVAGVMSLGSDFGTSSGKVAQGNDNRFNPAPSVAGKIAYDTGTGYSNTANGGTATKVLHGGTTPAYGQVVVADISSGAASSGQVPTADGAGGTSWANQAAGTGNATTTGFPDTSTVQKFLVPLYIYPTLAGWTNYYATSPKTGIVIANPSNGPGGSANVDYTAGILGMHTNGIQVIGYVHTRVTPGGAFRALATVEGEVDSWYSFYPTIDGIFFDEVDSVGGSTEVTYFTALWNYVRAKSTRNLVVLNPGTNTAEAYAGISDIIVTSENSYATYSGSYTVDAWTRKYPATKFCHIVHTCAPSNLAAAVNLTKKNRAGYTYVTDDAATYVVNPSYLTEAITSIGLVDGRFPMIYSGINGTTNVSPTSVLHINGGTNVTVSHTQTGTTEDMTVTSAYAGNTVTTGSFTVPAISGSVSVTVFSAAGFVQNTGITISDGVGGHSMVGYVTSVSGSVLTVVNEGMLSGAPTQTMASGATCSPSALAYTALGNSSYVFVGGATLGSFITGSASTVLALSSGGALGFTTITNAMIVAAAGIPYSKLTLTGSVLLADIAAAALIGTGTKLVTNTGATIGTPTISDYVTFTDQAANAGAVGRLQRNGANLSFHDGTAARNLILDNDSRLTDARTPTSVTQKRNFLINGDFKLWNRGATTFTPATATDTYTTERWRSNNGTGGASTISRQAHTVGQVLVPNEPQYYLRHVQGTGGTGAVYEAQQINDVRTAAGQFATASVYLRVSSGSATVTPKIIQSFGTGGSPHADVPTTGSGWTVNSASFSRFSYTFTVPSISGLGVGTTDGTSYVDFQIGLPTSSTYTIDIADAQFEIGSSATSYQRRPYGDELYDAEYYHSREIADVANFNYGPGYGSSGTTGCVCRYNYHRKMRAIPTITLSAFGTFRVAHSGTATTATAVGSSFVGLSGCQITASTAGSLALDMGLALQDQGASTSFIDIDAEF